MWPVYCVLSMWGKIMIPMYRLWLHNLYVPCSLLSPERPLNLITHSLLWPLFATAGDRPMDSQIDLKWRTQKCVFFWRWVRDAVDHSFTLSVWLMHVLPLDGAMWTAYYLNWASCPVTSFPARCLNGLWCPELLNFSSQSPGNWEDAVSRSACISSYTGNLMSRTFIRASSPSGLSRWSRRCISPMTRIFWNK